jgi:hypothetical protein
VHLLDIIAQLPYFQDEKHTSFCLIFTFILPHGHFLLTFLLPLLDLVMMICLHLLLDLSSLLSHTYVAADEMYLQLCAPIPRGVTL